MPNWGKDGGKTDVPGFWSTILSRGGQINRVDQVGRVAGCVGDYVRGFFWLVKVMKSGAIIFGPTGAGKTSLVKNALVHLRECLGDDFSVVVFDITGNYEGYTDYHAPYPLNVLELPPDTLVDVVEEVYQIAGKPQAITPTMAQNLETFLAWLLGVEPPPQGFDASRFPKTLGGLIGLARAAVSEGVIQGNLVESVMALVRRLNQLRHWLVDSETHPIIKRLLRGELRGRSVGIDLRVFRRGIRRWFYIVSFLQAVLNSGVSNLIVVVDEAHRYFRGEDTTLSELVRMGRNYGVFTILITQSPNDIPSEIFMASRVYVEFPIAYMNVKDLLSRRPTYKYAIGDEEPGVRPRGELEEHWRDIHVAMLHLQVMTKEAKEQFGPGLWTMPIKVDVEVQPKPEAVTLRKCAGKYGVPINLIWERGFDVQGKGDVLRGVWECIGM